MSFGFVLARARLSLAFARHIPPRRLARRMALALRRAYRDRMGWRARAVVPPTARTPPKPIFPARSGMIARTSKGLAFTFLGKSQIMPGAAIDWGVPSPAPEHQLWRMNLHYMEYLEETDDASFLVLVEQWIAANPPGRPGAWRDSWNAYALSVRVVVWMQQLAVRTARTPDDARARIVASLVQQLGFLECNLETDIGGNHLIKNIKALIWASAFFAGPEAARWRRLGLALLREALPEQILADGVHYERSPAYHNQVFADLLECRHALPAGQAPRELDNALRAMSIATADLAHPDDEIAQFNDSGLSMAYRPSECLAVFGALLGRPPAPRATFALLESGYFGRRSRDDYFIADCGRIGPDALLAHAHGDILSFEWSVEGKRIIVDPGVYEYVDGARRRASRSAAPHNTLSIEGHDQAEFFGAFRCGRRPNVTVRHCSLDADGLVLEGTHDGFGREATHVRRFEANSQGIRVVDHIDAQVGQKARIGFLLHPEVKCESEGDGFVLLRSRARIDVRSDVPLVLGDAVWWPDMGHEVATKRLCIDWSRGNGVIVTAFVLRTDRE